MQTQQSRASFAEENAAHKTNFDESNYTTKHRIYSRTLELFSNPRIRHRQSGMILSYVLHPQADIPNREEIEAEIFYFAEHHALDYEVVRDVPRRLYRELQRQGESNLIFENQIVALPNFILNALVCLTLQKEFSRADVLSCGGFVRRKNLVCLDLDETFLRSGFMMPVKSGGLITALRVFRYPADERPFILKSRSGWSSEQWQ